MKILVCINQVPDTTSKINLSGDKFDPSGVQFILNPSDESALNRALEMKETTGGSVTIIHVGKADAEPVIRKAFALGADRMIRIDAEPSDGFSVAKHLAQALKNESFELIFCGKESLDYNGGMVGGMLATLLNINFIDDVTKISVEGNSALVERETDGGFSELSAPLPLLVAVQKELVEESKLKIPNMRGIMNARKAPIEVIQQETIPPEVQIVTMKKPAPKPPVKMIDPENLDELITELHQVKKVI